MASVTLNAGSLRQFELPGFVSHLSLLVRMGDEEFQVDFSARPAPAGFVSLAEPARAASLEEAAEVVGRLFCAIAGQAAAEVAKACVEGRQP